MEKVRKGRKTKKKLRRNKIRAIMPCFLKRNVPSAIKRKNM